MSTTSHSEKSTVEEIRERFDNDVDRFSNLNTGQESAVDGFYCMKLFAQIASRFYKKDANVLDLGCGAGNYSLALREKGVGSNFTLVDLSMPMLQKAESRLSANGVLSINTIQDDVRNIDLKSGTFNIAVAAAMLHHLRDDNEWTAVFEAIYETLKPGGMFFVFDLIEHDNPEINEIIKNNYGIFLENQGGAAYKEKVFDYIAKEDSPRSINFQTELMKKVGFKTVDVVHKNTCFGAFLGIK